MTEGRPPHVTGEMVSRFLPWKLPEDWDEGRIDEFVRKEIK